MSSIISQSSYTEKDINFYLSLYFPVQCYNFILQSFLMNILKEENHLLQNITIKHIRNQQKSTYFLSFIALLVDDSVAYNLQMQCSSNSFFIRTAVHL